MTIYTSARTVQKYYKLCTQIARDELKLVESAIGKYNTPYSTNYENVHYSCDFSEPDQSHTHISEKV